MLPKKNVLLSGAVLVTGILAVLAASYSVLVRSRIAPGLSFAILGPDTLIAGEAAVVSWDTSVLNLRRYPSEKIEFCRGKAFGEDCVTLNAETPNDGEAKVLVLSTVQPGTGYLRLTARGPTKSLLFRRSSTRPVELRKGTVLTAGHDIRVTWSVNKAFPRAKIDFCIPQVPAGERCFPLALDVANTGQSRISVPAGIPRQTGVIRVLARGTDGRLAFIKTDQGIRLIEQAAAVLPEGSSLIGELALGESGDSVGAGTGGGGDGSSGGESGPSAPPPPAPPPPPPPAPSPPPPASAEARMKFFIHPSFVTDTTLAEVGQRLQRYVNDLNVIFGKNTVRRFVFDPATDVAVWTNPFPTGGTCYALQPGYSYWVMVDVSTSAGYGATAGCNFYNQNSLVVHGFRWSGIWSSAEIADAYRTNYTIGQLYPLLHELGHAHGLALAEYYNLRLLRDTTGAAPTLDVNESSNPGGPYWGGRSLVRVDPMFESTSAEHFMQDIQFSPLGATLINKTAQGAFDASCEGLTPLFCTPPQISSDTASLLVEARARATNAPLSNCSVTIYNVVTGSSGVATVVAQGTTNSQGTFAAPWGGGEPHTNSNMARLVKVNCSGYPPNGDWVTVFDLQAGVEMPSGGAAGDFHYPGKLTILM